MVLVIDCMILADCMKLIDCMIIVDRMMLVIDWCSGRQLPCNHNNQSAILLTYDSDTTLGEVAMKVSILPWLLLPWLLLPWLLCVDGIKCFIH